MSAIRATVAQVAKGAGKGGRGAAGRGGRGGAGRGGGGDLADAITQAHTKQFIRLGSYIWCGHERQSWCGHMPPFCRLVHVG